MQSVKVGFIASLPKAQFSIYLTLLVPFHIFRDITSRKNVYMRIFLMFIVLLSVKYAGAQSWNEYFEAGNGALENEDYFSSNYYFGKCMELDSTVFDLNVRYAESLRLTKKYHLAEHQYGKVFSKDKGKLFPLGQFKLGEMLYMNGKYKEAVRNFKKFKRKRKKDVDASFYDLAEQWVKTATFALNTKNAVLDSRLENVPSVINEGELQLSPVMRDSTLYFSSYSELGDFLELKEVMITDSLIGEKNSIVVLGIDAELDLANLTFGKGAEVFFSVCSEDTCAIYEGQFEANVISSISELSFFASSESVSMPHYTQRNGKEFLFFVSNAEGGQGSRDIWYAQRSGDAWSNGINLGKTINTPGEEVSPFYDGEKLFFSSNWHNGFGGFDIVFSEGWLAQWKEVTNPGKPINSSYHDLYYTYNTEDKKGWFSSNRVSGENLLNSTCCSKIYAFEYPDSLEVGRKSYKDLEELNKHLPVTLFFHNDEPNPRTKLIETEFNYLTTYQEYLELIPAYKKENSRGTRGESKLDAELDVEDFFELLVEKGVSDLALFSKLLLKELATGKSVELEVKGYASPRAKSDYNEKLSRRRINSLVNYLNEYEGGVFRPYLKQKAFNGAELIIVENPFGEQAAAKGVSDALEDEKESIYSRGARLERKIEIRSVTFKETELKESEAVIELGDIREGEMISSIYTLTNSTDMDIQLDSIVSSCGCTVPSLMSDFIPAGESIDITLEFDASEKEGYQEKKVAIYSSSFTEPKVLIIKSFIH